MLEKRFPGRMLLVVLTLSMLTVLAGCTSSDEPSADAVVPVEEPTVSYLVEGGPYGRHFHGIHGLTFDAQDRLFAGSVVGQAVYLVDPNSGAVSEYLSRPRGMADDLEWSPDGATLAWTAFLLGKVFARDGEDGEIREIASGLPGANSIAWSEDGRLFFTQVFAGDALWELDPSGAEQPRLIAENLGGLNGFDLGPDGWLYGPLWFGGKVVRVDVDRGVIETVADGFQTPAAVNFDSQGGLFVVDTEAGEVLRVDTANGETSVVATVRPSIDNLAFDSSDRLFISNMAWNAIYEIDIESGDVRTVVEEKLSVPAGLAAVGDTLYLADTFAYRTIDTRTGAVEDVRTMMAQDLEELDYPISAFANEEHVLLTSWSSATVQTVDRRTQESLSMRHGFAAPVAAVELGDGRLVVAELASGNLVVVEGEGESETRSVAFEGLAGAVGMIPAGPTSVYLTELGTGSVARIDIDSGERVVVAEGLSGPEGLAELPDGRIAVAEVGRQRLVAIDPSGAELSVLAEGLAIGLEAPAGTPPAYVPTGVAVAGDGSVYVSSDLEGAIYRVRVE